MIEDATRQTAAVLTTAPESIDSLRSIVNLVRTGRAVTRPQLGRVTGYGRGLVAQRVADAMELGFIEEGASGVSTGGRAPRTLRFRGENGLIAVCALGALHVSIALATLDGEVLESTQEIWAIANGPESTLAKVRQVFSGMQSRSRAPIWGAVVGVPGPVEFETGVTIAPPTMPGWTGFDVRGHFERIFNCPVWVDSDVNLRVLGAARELASQGFAADDVVYLKVGTGVAVGLLSGGRLHRGAAGAAGDIGHRRIPGNTVPCRCGRLGCLEAVGGGFGLVTQATGLADSGRRSELFEILAHRDLTPDDVATAARRDDVLATDLIAASGQALGGELATMIDLFNPSLLVLGGSIAESGGTFLAAVRRAVYEQALPLTTRHLTIMITPRADDAVAGGVQLVLDELFSERFEQWAFDGSPVAQLASGD